MTLNVYSDQFSAFLEDFKIQLQFFVNRVNRVLITFNQEPSKPSTTRTEMPIPNCYDSPSANMELVVGDLKMYKSLYV